MALKLNASASSIYIALVSIAFAHAGYTQALSSGIDQGVGGSNDSNPGARPPLLVYGVDAGIGESDNVTLASTDKVSQTIAIADLDFTLKEQSRLLEAHATGNFSDLNYLEGAYGNQLLGRFDGIAHVAVVPGRMIWTVSDDFGQAALDPYTPETPTNLEDINYFSTGPDFYIHMGGVNFVSASARYSRAQYQTSPYNSNGLSASLALGRDVSAGAAVSLNAAFDRVMFANTVLNSDFDRTSGFARYQLHGARTDFEADAGITSVRQQALPASQVTATEGTGAVANLALSSAQASGSTTGGSVKLLLTRKLSASATLSLTAGRELTDGGTSFSALQGGGSLGSANLGGVSNAAAPALQSSANYTRNYASLGWGFFRNRTTLALNAGWEKDDYPGQSLLDVTRPTASFSAQRRLTRALSAELLGRWSKTDYSNVVLTTAESQSSSSDYGDWQVGAGLTWRYGRGLEVRLRGYHDSHVVSVGGGGFAEDRVFLTIGYRPYATPIAN